MTDQQRRMVETIDRMEIRELVTRYPLLVDTRRFDDLIEVFTPDVEVNFHNGRTILHDAQSVVSYLADNTAHLAWQHHHVSVYAVELAGDEACVPAHLLSHQQHAGAPGHVLMMASTYDVRTRRVDGEWRISYLEHRIQLVNFLPVNSVPPEGFAMPAPVRP